MPSSATNSSTPQWVLMLLVVFVSLKTIGNGMLSWTGDKEDTKCLC